MTVTADPLRGNAHLVDALGSALRSGEHGLSTVPGLLKRVLAEESWREFITQRGEHVIHQRFAEFVVAKPLKGIGASVDLIRRVLEAFPDKAEAAKARDLLDRALQNPAHLHHDDNIVQVKAPQGNARDRALRKLRSDAPELHAEVLAGNLTAHGAMVKAGFRLRTLTVQPNPAAAARTLRKHLTAEQCAELAWLLTHETSDR